MRTVGLTPAQHQLLLAVKGHCAGHAPTIGDLASYLLLRHHSTVELVDRAKAAGLVERWVIMTTAASSVSGSPPTARNGSVN